MYATADCRRKAARFFQNVHKIPRFLVHMVGNMHKRRSNLVRVAPLLWPLFNEFGLNLGNFLVYLVADKLHKVQKEFPVGYLEDVLLAI